MKKDETVFGGRRNRRSFLKSGMVAAGAAAAGAGLASAPTVFARNEEDRAPITRGDIAILRFLSALEQVETDLWVQYAELAGPTKNVPGTLGNSPVDLVVDNTPITTGLAPSYIQGLLQLDGDMPQYIADNTDDEISHHRWLNNYLESKGAKRVDLGEFKFFRPSGVSGVPTNLRLTNLKNLTVDTSWWTRYRSDSLNPDLGDTNFPNAVPDLAKGRHPAIPDSDSELEVDAMGNISDHLQAVANTAGFHFGFIEQGGSSLYPSLAQRVTNLEVLRILLSIGPTETMHFQTWSDKAGNAPKVTDGALSFPGPDGLNGNTDPNVADTFQTNLIMPEPTFFLHKGLGTISIIRPTDTRNAAHGAVMSLVDDGLFFDPSTGQNSPIVARLMQLAEEADEARRGF